jgi:hypothetical protein
MASPFDPMCGRYACDMEELDAYVDPGFHRDREDYIKQEEGTYNKSNGHFLCDSCYIRAGMPVGDNGSRWVCP